ncbi:PREDICTED: arf-GAP domain and FG repeat-containing protein 1 isoform X3 [Nicrophorus vespilloides]|uniref:Arf-GAP domain and FG repeat-containing protein 1 isoform X3 n=1 Tax=Nicrophorus vespilloides TaxID=110193 RepID=A0ABM1MH03_NICVS|nr:PREDICTED: arf-GAP domain and FG repeat-containing protein 1 isoform X3 [Nicrophorus vespilloides]
MQTALGAHAVYLFIENVYLYYCFCVSSHRSIAQRRPRRGLTPPHRVKSISMATFTQEEIDLLRTRGNDYCQKIWLGLYDGTKPVDRDEQAVHTLMLDKYERKRYYMEPSVALKNGYNKQQTVTATESSPMKTQEAAVKPLATIIAEPRPLRVNGDKTTKHDFVADFAHANIYNAANNNATAINNTIPSNTTTNQLSFANFDNNTIFNNASEDREDEEEFSIFNLQFTNNGPVYNHIPLFPKMNVNRWSMPLTTMNGLNGSHHNNQQQLHHQQSHPSSNGPSAPSEDRYAALKDLDNAFKAQPMLDWTSTGSNSSLYSSPTTAGSIYSSTASPQSSSYGSPSQGQFMNQFLSQEPSNISNPFNSNGIWGAANGNNQHCGSNGINPFFSTPTAPDTYNMNGGGSMFSTPPINGTTWIPNPFKVANGHSNNPFL